MSLQSIRPAGKVFIPPCKNALCESWILKIDESLKSDLECVTKPPINGTFCSQFKQHFQECDFTILHFCPYLWKRISKIEEYLRKEEGKLILVTFQDERLAECYRKVDEKVSHSLNIFFEDFDSDQILNDDFEAFQTFKDNVLLCLSENTHPVAATYVDTRSQLSLSKEYELEEEFMDEDEENEEDIVNFVNYPHFISNFNSLFVSKNIAQHDGHIEIPFSGTDIESLKKTMQILNELGSKHSKEEVTYTLKHLLNQIIPNLYEERDVVRLASFTMCRHSSIHGRAMDSLELLLWEIVDQLQDFKILNHVQHILTEALRDLQLDYKQSRDKRCLMMLQRVANLHLIVLGSLLILSQETPEMSTKCYSYFKTRSESPFVPSKPELSFDLKKQFEADTCLSVIDNVVKGAKACKHKSAGQILQEINKPEKLLEKMAERSMAVHLSVVTHLLRKVFSLDKEAVGILEKYMDGPREKSPFVFTILHSLTLFLAYETQKDAHKDIHEICNGSVNIIRKAIPNGKAEQVDNFLQCLLFSSNPFIRREFIKLFRDKDRYGLKLAYMQNEMDQRLSPLLTNFEGDSNAQFGWKKATGQFNNQDVLILYYSMNEKDHKKNQTDFPEKDLYFTELKRLESLQHKNIIKMFAYQCECIPQFYITENCDQHLQGHLENKWKNNAWYTPSQLLQFLVDAVTALEYCHKRGYVHCNLTAESLIVFEHTHVKLAGFGLCKKIDASTTKAHDINSKHIPIRWSAPESILEGEYSKSSDIWMVGHLLYEVMTHGLLPYAYMDKDDEELIELMKTKELKPTIEPVVERKEMLQLLGKCTAFDQESRIYVANVRTTLKNILIKVKQLPERNVPAKDFEPKKSSTNCKRGVPEKFYKRTAAKVFGNLKGRVQLSPYMERFQEGKDFMFREKMTHELSASMETFFKSPILDSILPQRREIVQHPSEMKKIECRIPCENCLCLLDVALKKMVKEVEIISFLQMVAAKLAELSKHNYVIGDICASNVYVELTDAHEVHIISLVYLRVVDSDEEQSLTGDDRIKTTFYEGVKRRASPEVIKYGRFSAASDVFCFGNLMWELLTAFSQAKPASLPFNKHAKIFKGLNGNEPKEISDAILSGEWEKYHPQPKRCPDSLYELIKSCVSAETERPAMNHIAIMLQGIKEEYCSGSKSNISSDQAVTDASLSTRNSLTFTVANPSVKSGSTGSSRCSSVSSLLIANPSTCSSSSSLL